MTKQKISITVDEKALEMAESMIDGDLFRNRSHVIEYILKRFLRENQEKLNFGN